MPVKSLGLLTAAWTAAVVTPAMAAPPANDNFADARRVGIGVEYSGTLAEATAELGEPNAEHSVWFRYRAAHSGPLTVDTGGSESYAMITVYTGSDFSTLREVTSDVYGSPTGPGSVVRFKAHRHRVYRIAVDTIDEPLGYKLWLSDGGIKGKGVALTVDPGQTVEIVRSHGLRLNVTARRRVGTALTLRVSPRTARRLGLKSRVLGRASGPVDYGQSLNATIPLTHAARAALEGVNHVAARVRLTLPASTAPDKTLTVPVRF